MNNDSLPHVDWRRELVQLDPYIGGTGCVVRIYYNGDPCAWRRFNSVLKQRYAKVASRRLSLRIDHSWHTTHLMEDIIAAFQRKLESAGYDPPAIDHTRREITLLSHNGFFGEHTEINVDNVNIASSSPFELREQRDAAIASICSRIAAFLESGGRMMVVMNQAPVQEQGWFWTHFWYTKLERLVSDGLLLIHLVDRSQPENLSSAAPDPRLTLVLPTNFEEDSRQEDAYDDLIDVIEARGVSRDEAVAMAISHLNSNMSSVEVFYNNLANLLWKVDALVATRTQV